MHRVAFLLVSLLCCACLAASGLELAECDRSRSKLARAIVDQVILDHADWSKTKVPVQCKLHPKRDMHSSVDSAEGSQGFSGSSLIHDGHDVCLADLCDTLHCDYLAHHMDLEGTKGLRKYDENATCDPERTLALRRQCNALTHACFVPDGGKNAHITWLWMRDDFCGAHVCDLKERNALLTSIVKVHHKKHWMYFVVAIGIAAVGIAAFVAIYVYQRFGGFTLGKKDWENVALLQHMQQMQKSGKKL